MNPTQMWFSGVQVVQPGIPHEDEPYISVNNETWWNEKHVVLFVRRWLPRRDRLGWQALVGDDLVGLEGLWGIGFPLYTNRIFVCLSEKSEDPEITVRFNFRCIRAKAYNIKMEILADFLRQHAPDHCQWFTVESLPVQAPVWVTTGAMRFLWAAEHEELRSTGVDDWTDVRETTPARWLKALDRSWRHGATHVYLKKVIRPLFNIMMLDVAREVEGVKEVPEVQDVPRSQTWWFLLLAMAWCIVFYFLLHFLGVMKKHLHNSCSKRDTMNRETQTGDEFNTILKNEDHWCTTQCRNNLINLCNQRNLVIGAGATKQAMVDAMIRRRAHAMLSSEAKPEGL